MSRTLEATSLATSYKALQLRRSASRELVEEAYWALIAELKLAQLPEAARFERMAELNHAYEEITSTPIEGAPLPQPERRHRLAPRTKRTAGTSPNFYELLQIDEEATHTVVLVAARHVAKRSAIDRSASRDLREAAARACEVLTDPSERLEYDLRLGIRSHDHGAATQVKESRVAAASGADEVEQSPSAATPSPAPPPGPAQAAPHKHALDDVPVEGREDAPRTSTSVWPALLGRQVARVATSPWERRRRAESVASAETERLLTLRAPLPMIGDPSVMTPGDDAHPASPDHNADLPAPFPRIDFETGPLAGTTLPITSADADMDGVELSLPNGDGAQTSLRVVRRGDGYMLLHLDGPAVSIAGQEMVPPVIVLENGDTISAGGSSFRFLLS